MAIYIQLLTLTPQGRERIFNDPENVLRVQDRITVPGIQALGQYGVLGPYDFVNIVEAPDNDAIARFSLQLGVMAGVHIITMPAIPLGRLEYSTLEEAPVLGGESRALRPPDPPEGLPPSIERDDDLFRESSTL